MYTCDNGHTSVSGGTFHFFLGWPKTLPLRYIFMHRYKQIKYCPWHIRCHPLMYQCATHMPCICWFENISIHHAVIVTLSLRRVSVFLLSLGNVLVSPFWNVLVWVLCASHFLEYVFLQYQPYSFQILWAGSASCSQLNFLLYIVSAKVWLL